MHQIVIDKIEYHNQEIKNAIQKDPDVAIAASIMPNARIWLDYEVNVCWNAKSIDEVKAALRAFAKAGFLLSEFEDSPNNPAWIIRGSVTTIRLSPTWYAESANVEGATCKLIQVGVQEQQPIPIYKLKCFDKDGNEVPSKAEESSNE